MSWDDGMGMIARAEHQLAQEALQDQFTQSEMQRMAGERGGLPAYWQEQQHREATDRVMRDQQQRAAPVSSGTPMPQSTSKPGDLPSFKDIVAARPKSASTPATPAKSPRQIKISQLVGEETLRRAKAIVAARDARFTDGLHHWLLSPEGLLVQGVQTSKTCAPISKWPDMTDQQIIDSMESGISRTAHSYADFYLASMAGRTIVYDRMVKVISVLAGIIVVLLVIVLLMGA